MECLILLLLTLVAIWVLRTALAKPQQPHFPTLKETVTVDTATCASMLADTMRRYR